MRDVVTKYHRLSLAGPKPRISPALIVQTSRPTVTQSHTWLSHGTVFRNFAFQNIFQFDVRNCDCLCTFSLPNDIQKEHSPGI